MVNRIWLGGGNNKADNPKLWDPTGVPQPTDNMYMPQGTINFMGGDYSQMGLVLLGNDTVNLSQGTKIVAAVQQGGGPATINIKNDDHLALQIGGPGNPSGSSVAGIVDLAANSHWVGGFDVIAEGPNVATLVVHAGNKASFIDDGTSNFMNGVGVFGPGARATFDTEISGTTTVRVFDGGTLEVGRSVGPGQTVLLSGPSILQVDKTDQFLGAVNLIGASGAIDLEGLANADSYAFQNDMLSIFSAGKVIDTLRLTDSTPNGFVVEQAVGSVNVIAITDPANPPIGVADPYGVIGTHSNVSDLRKISYRLAAFCPANYRYKTGETSMVTRTWVGGGNNKASNTRDWSPTGVPQADDVLQVNAGDTTVNIEDNDLAGNPLVIRSNGNVAVNLSKSATATIQASTTGVTIGIRGTDILHLQGGAGAQTTVNIAPNSEWDGQFSQGQFGSVTINGGPRAEFVNQGESDFGKSQATVNVPVTGTGSFGMGAETGLTFLKPVGPGQQITMVGGPNGLSLGDPQDFQGSVVMQRGTQIGGPDFQKSEGISLLGLANADSYTFKNDLLSIFSGNKVIDTLRLTDQTLSGFVVQQGSAGVLVSAITDPSNPPVGLPIHMG